MNVYEGSIVTCDRNSAQFRYLVEDEGMIRFVGDFLPAEYAQHPRTDLGEKALLPAFADTHLHYSNYAFFSASLDVRGASSIDEIIGMIEKYVAAHGPKTVLGFGVSAHNVKEKRLIEKADLERAFPRLPVMLIKYDGHASVNNAAMLALLPAAVRGLRGYHADTGQLNQEAYFAATDFITKKVSTIDLVKNTLGAFDRLAQKGIGMIHTVEGIGFPKDLDVDLVRFIARGLSNPMSVRLFFQTMDVNKVLKRKLPRIGGCFATALDGCFGSVDAALHEAYQDDAQNKGVLFYAQEDVNAFTKNANRAGLQIEMHAIGDAAFDQAVNALEAALKDYPREDHRHSVIHACLPTEKGLAKAARLGIGIAAQPAFIHWPLEPQDYLESILGARAQGLNPLKTMHDYGITVSGGSDAPCTLPDPIEGIYCACNHTLAGESLSIPEALKLFTSNAAWMSFDEKQRGTLGIGKIADMVILNKNPLVMKPGELRELQVESLLLKGQPYKPGQGILSMLVRGVAPVGT
ncbi:MAG: amidohydrolase family protein [Deltaproteobacteria bacterium]|nr:amidohydrolase family protein [Deltaproteobacteria bacterium]